MSLLQQAYKQALQDLKNNPVIGPRKFIDTQPLSDDLQRVVQGFLHSPAQAALTGNFNQVPPRLAQSIADVGTGKTPVTFGGEMEELPGVSGALASIQSTPKTAGLSDMKPIYHTLEQINEFKQNVLRPDVIAQTHSDLQAQGIPLNPDGTVTLYRGASKELGDNIRPQSYFSTDLKTAKRFGKVSEVRVQPEALMSQGQSMASGGVTFINPTELVKGRDGIYRIPDVTQPSSDVISAIKQAVKSKK